MKWIKLLLLDATKAEAVETATRIARTSEESTLLTNNATPSRDPDFKNISVQ